MKIIGYRVIVDGVIWDQVATYTEAVAIAKKAKKSLMRGTPITIETVR